MSALNDSSGERRGPYRKGQPSSQPLGSKLLIPASAPVACELIDLSAKGAGVGVPFAIDPNLSVGDVIEITIGSMMRESIETPARVVTVGQAGAGLVRYGLEFISVGNLYSQLDSFYARFFNRRRDLRVRPPFDQAIPVEFATAAGDRSARVYDISESGMSLALPLEAWSELEPETSGSIRFQLPCSGAVVWGLVSVRYDVKLEKRRLVGIEFDLDSPGGISLHVPAIRQYIAERLVQMEQWEKSWSTAASA